MKKKSIHSLNEKQLQNNYSLFCPLRYGNSKRGEKRPNPKRRRGGRGRQQKRPQPEPPRPKKFTIEKNRRRKPISGRERGMYCVTETNILV